MRRRAAIAAILGLVTTMLVFQLGCSSDWVKTQYEDYHKRTAELDTETIVAGLKEALKQGTQRGVSSLGRLDGYMSNAQVRIPIPDHLHKVEKLLRKTDADKYADQFVLSLNRAAEAAVPQAKAIFFDVIRNMTIQDAVEVLRGTDDAATQYFRRQSEARLVTTFQPIVMSTTDRFGVTAKYKRFVDKASRTGLIDTTKLDLDEYVTRKALDGLFYIIAEEERRIRRDPVARTTEILRKVFR